MVDYPAYMKRLRERYIPDSTTVPIVVQLPPTKTDCTCFVSSELSMLNAPSDYCEACENKGYIETPVTKIIPGVVVDFISDTQVFPGMLHFEGAYNFDAQRYVIHAHAADCAVASFGGKNCFDISKEVTIDGEDYRILSIDKSTLLDQVKVVISRTN